MKAVAALLCILGASAAIPPKLRDTPANEYVDKLLANLRELIRKDYDPLAIPASDRYGFSKKILGIPVWGYAQITGGQLTGLTSIKRTGDAELKAPDDKTVVLNAKLGTDQLNADCGAHAEFEGIGLSPAVIGQISSVDVTFGLRYDLSPGNKPQITALDVNSVNGVVAVVTGLGPLDWILDGFVEFAVTFFKGEIVDLLEPVLRDLLQDLIDEYLPPIPPHFHESF